MNPLKINGLIIENFPFDKYEAIYSILSSKYTQNNVYEHFSGAWNALSYRYKATTDHGKDFIELLNLHGTTPPPEERYLQEKALFDHFSSCFSIFESICYGFFALGSIIDPIKFAINNPEDQRKISPEKTEEMFRKVFPSEEITKALTKLISDTGYKEIRNTRNILTHRISPGRKVYVNIGKEESPQTEWKLNNKPLNETIIKLNENTVKIILDNLLEAGYEFCKLKL